MMINVFGITFSGLEFIEIVNFYFRSVDTNYDIENNCLYKVINLDNNVSL